LSIFSSQHLSKKYLSKYVLQDVSFTLSAGHFYILMAPNGAGKSTVLRLIMGLERPTAGTMSFLGSAPDQDGIPFHLRGQIGLVAETVEYDPSASLMRFLKFYAGLFPTYDLTWLCAMAQVRNIDLTQKFQKLSRGQKMQIILLAELAKRPKLLLIDEITSVLDPYSRAFYLNLLSEFTRQGGTVLLTTNVIHEVESSASDLLILRDGKVAWEAPISSIFEQFTKIMVAETLTEEVRSRFLVHKFYPLDRLQSEGRWMSILVGPSAALPLISLPYVKIHMGAEDLFKYFFQSSTEPTAEKKAEAYDLRAA